MPDEEVPSLDTAIGAAVGVVGTGQGKEFEGLPCLYQRVRYPIGRLGRHIVIGLPYHQQEGAAEPPGICDIGLFVIVFSHGIAHPLFVPPLFVYAVVMTAAGGDGGLVKVAVEEQAAKRVLAAGGCSVKPDPGGVY